MAKRGEGLKRIKVNMKDVATMTLGELYGTEPIPVTELTKRLWALIKAKNLRIKE